MTLYGVLRRIEHLLLHRTHHCPTCKPRTHQQGATPQEAAEAIGVTFLMNGGPATIYGARAFDACREFYEQAAEHDKAA